MKTKNQKTILINNKFFFLAFIFITIQVHPVFSQTQKTDVQLTLKPGHLNYKDNATEIIGIDSSYNITTDTGYVGAEHYCNHINNIKTIHNVQAIELINFYPNPAIDNTSFFYKLPFESFVNVTLYNSIGQVVKEFVNEYKIPGYYKIEFNCRELPSGVYFNMFKAGGVLTKTKLIVIK